MSTEIQGRTSCGAPLVPRLVKPPAGAGGLTCVLLCAADGTVLASVPISLTALPDTAGGDLAAAHAALASLLVRASPGTRVGSSALEQSHVVSGSACTLRSAKALNNTASDLWLYILDAATLPSNGAAPSRTPIPVPAGSVNGDTWAGGTSLATGCVLALSSTLATLTLVSTANGWFDAEIG
jgi:hypothetical protein